MQLPHILRDRLRHKQSNPWAHKSTVSSIIEPGYTVYDDKCLFIVHAIAYLHKILHPPFFKSNIIVIKTGSVAPPVTDVDISFSVPTEVDYAVTDVYRKGYGDYPEYDDGNLYNSAAVIRDGAVVARYRKQLLPNYGVFDEKRYFEPGSVPCVVEIQGVPVGLNVCEDIWQPEPMAQAVAAGAHALFFQCGLGHMMGLDVHDMEGLGENYVGYNESIHHLSGLRPAVGGSPAYINAYAGLPSLFASPS